MALWSGFVDLLQLCIFGLTHLYGGHLGPAILTFALLARLTLLPLTLRLALRSRAQARAMKRLRPALDALRERWKEDPARLGQETLALYERKQVSPLDPVLLKGSLVQAPLFLGLFKAIRGVLSGAVGRQPFLWIGNLASPDLFLAMGAAGVVGLGVAVGAPEHAAGGRALLLVAFLGTFFMLTRLSAGFGLYVGASGIVSLLQGLMVRRIDVTDDS